MRKTWEIGAAVLTLAVIGGCTSALTVHRFGQEPIDASEHAFVLLEPSEWETQFRLALDDRKLTLHKFASNITVRQSRTVDSAGARFESERSFVQSGARYGLTLTKRKQVDHCPWNTNVNATFTLEVTDLKTNDVVLLIEHGNWTGLCGPFSVRSRYVFDEIADEMAKAWKR